MIEFLQWSFAIMAVAFFGSLVTGLCYCIYKLVTCE